MAGDANSRLVKKLLLGVALMFGFAFALVPLYDVFCQVTGINGKTGGAVAAPSLDMEDDSRVITVEFVAYISGDLPWEFKPEVTRVEVHPGERKTVQFYAKNLANHEIVAQAIPSVAPGLGAKYFHKIECFCFNRQPLAAKQDTQMGLLFFLDPELPPEIQTLTLSYTLYNLSARENS
ncbi:cytochrome c oxidase assembly protein [Gallaecimonas xiamenensis]|uniref:Cytochrome c oxidase assembly protein CtaG n=1 Tax=Gallaecimonas xiamenensis 3-C-1 TaxID=745411 RepID=K2J399_9GAMM|nr:cytochrome c oxidase assembly protein [Gallaecimonas xiamenensis]EKE77491.1 cytochrome C oxidase assembly protein [Gallaecimonas xiamenensis 3-C-1]